MTGKITIPVTLTKADFDILRLLDKNCHLMLDVRFAVGTMIFLDVSAFTNSEDAVSAVRKEE